MHCILINKHVLVETKKSTDNLQAIIYISRYYQVNIPRREEKYPARDIPRVDYYTQRYSTLL